MTVLMFLQWCCWGIHSGHHIPGKPNAWFKYHYMVYEFFQITQCKQALNTNIICITGALCHCFYLKIWVGLIGRRFEGMAWVFRISCYQAGCCSQDQFHVLWLTSPIFYVSLPFLWWDYSWPLWAWGWRMYVSEKHKMWVSIWWNCDVTKIKTSVNV